MAPTNADLSKTYGLPEEQIAQLKTLFDQFDIDKDGEITADEIYKAMKSTGSGLTESVAKNIMKGADSNGDGRMNFSEFVASLAPKFKAQSRRQSLDATFKEFDKNKDGYVTAEELQEAWTKQGMPLTLKEAKIMIAAVDADQDKKVTLQEFRKIWKMM